MLENQLKKSYPFLRGEKYKYRGVVYMTKIQLKYESTCLHIVYVQISA